MVMVANRKTEQQMAEDLSLFLSNNTNKFTTWFVSIRCYCCVLCSFAGMLSCDSFAMVGHNWYQYASQSKLLLHRVGIV